MLLDTLGLWLHDNAAGVTLWNGTTGNLFLSEQPEGPDQAITLYERPGFFPLRQMGSSAVPIRRPRLQVMVRDTTYPQARTLAETVWLSLESIVNETINGDLVQRVSADADPAPVGEDDNGRELLAMNFTVDWQPS